LPFAYTGDNWVYDAFCEQQKRSGVFNSQFLTPDKTVDRLGYFMGKYFPCFTDVLEPCCGTGQITKEILRMGFGLTAFDVDLELVSVCKLLNEVKYQDFNVFKSDFREVSCRANQIIANPPYEVSELTDFFEWIDKVQDVGGHLRHCAILWF
jgi:predicted RNA methylase